MFDISKLDTLTRSEAGVPMPILHPRTQAPMLDSEGKPVTITLLGPSSEKSKALQRVLQARRAEMQAKGVIMSAEDFARERHEFLVGVTTGWTFDRLGDEPFPFTPDNSRKFWADARWEWLQADAWRFAQADGNYLPS